MGETLSNPQDKNLMFEFFSRSKFNFCNKRNVQLLRLEDNENINPCPFIYSFFLLILKYKL